jgi:hypothetical protein
MLHCTFLLLFATMALLRVIKSDSHGGQYEDDSFVG